MGVKRGRLVAAVCVILLGVLAGGYLAWCSFDNSIVDTAKLSSGNMGYTKFGGTVADIDRNAKTVTVALKWEVHSNQECNKTLTCDYGEISDKECLELIEQLSAGNEVRASSRTNDYYEKDPVPLSYICLEDGSRGEQWIATKDRYPADPSYDEKGFKRGELESLGIGEAQ